VWTNIGGEEWQESASNDGSSGSGGGAAMEMRMPMEQFDHNARTKNIYIRKTKKIYT